MNDQDPASTRAQEILDVTWAFLKEVKVEALICWLGLTLISVSVDLKDMYAGNESNSSLLINIAQIFAFYYLLLALVRKNGLRQGPINAGGIYFGIALLSGLATVIGLVLLIIPGLFLLVRWAPA